MKHKLFSIAAAALLTALLCITALATEEATVYLDGTGQTDGAYMDLKSAVAALPNGGIVIVAGDTTVGTSAAGVTLPAVGGKVTVTGENGATLTIARSLTLSSEIEFNNIILSNASANRGTIIACGNPVTIGEGVTCKTTAGERYLTIYGGAASGTVSYDSHVVVKSGYFRNVFGGSANGTFGGNSLVEIYASVHNMTYGVNEVGTFNGTSTLKLYSGAVCGKVVSSQIHIDLTNRGTVSAASFSGDITVTVPDGYEAVTDGLTYSVREIATEPAPTKVYVDGTAPESGDGLTPGGAVKTLSEAALLLRDGGTVVVCGDTPIRTATRLPASGALFITSKDGETDYTETAALQFANDLTLGAQTTFADIVLDRAAAGNDYIIANGNPLVIDENVYCRNTLATNYITIVGGAMSGNFEGASNITVKSGYFRNIYGGNYNGTFKGDSYITVTGGFFDNMIAGGSFMGNFKGDAHVNIGGDAVMVYLSTTQGVIGSSCGSGSTPYTFDGNIYMNLHGNCRINSSVYGASRYGNVTTTGNVEITVKDDAFIYQNLYAGGYAGTLNGSTKVVVDDGWVGVNLAGGSRGGTVNGDAYVEVNGGKLNYFQTNLHSSYSDVPGEYNIGGGGLSGAVNGNTAVVINGGDIYGNVYGGALSASGSVSGNSTVTVTGGSILCGVSAGGVGSGSAAGEKKLTIDLSGGGDLALGMSAAATELIGGGSLTLFPEAILTAERFSGNIALSINGIPQAKPYITAAETDNASVTYAAQENEVFAETVRERAVDYGVTGEGYFAATEVTILHHADAEIFMRSALNTEGEKLAAVSAANGKTVYRLAPGLYNYAVYHASNDYKRKFIYITGKEEALTVDVSSYAPKNGNGFEASNFRENTEEILDAYYNTDDLIGFAIPDTPYFENNRYGTRQFTSNDEMNAFIRAKVDSCRYAYAYDLFTSPSGNTVPAVLFTKDEIPADATLEKAADIVSATAGRDILMVTAIVHGNEPSAGEGALAIISELCGAYGDELLTGNIGAVIVIPRLNPDGCEAFTRNTPTAVGESNLNRDYAMLTSAEIAGVVKAYDLFMPTLLIDCHEAPADPQYGESYTLSDVYDVGLMTAGTLNTPFADASAVIRGNYADRGMYAASLLTAAMEGIEETGLRAYYYQTPMTYPANNSSYGMACGSYTFLIEVPGISGGDAFFARRVFAQTTAIKEIFALAAESDGKLAAEVNEARKALARSAQIFNAETPVVLQHGYTRHDTATLLWNNPLVAADATTRKATNTTKYYLQDVAVKYRSRPTAYVIPADADGIAKVLAVLDKQSIAYHRLDAGVALTLAQYGGTASSASLGAPAEVAFENGAYIIPVDGCKAYLIALLFEPENIDSGDYIMTFVQAGYLKASEIYRSVENYIAAKLGLRGAYVELTMPAGKTLAGAVVDDVRYGADEVGVEGQNAYVLASDSEFYTAVLTFTDGTSERYTLGRLPCDFSGNGSVGIEDALLALHAVLNGRATADMDVSGDGKVTLLDVLQILKIIAA